MIFLFLGSILPYLVLFVGSWGEILMPPFEVLLVMVTNCVVFHGMFLWACKRTGYSFVAITYFFFWIFLGLAPLMCALTGRWLWGDITHELSTSIVKSSVLCLLFVAVFQLVYARCFKRGLGSRFLVAGGAVSDAGLVLGLCFSLAMSLCVLAGLGIEGTFFRAAIESYVATGVMPVFIQNFIRPMPLLIGVPMLWVMMNGRLSLSQPRTWLAMVTVSMAFLINLPVSVARYYGWMVVCVFFYYMILNRKLGRNYWLPGVFLIAGFFGSFVVDVARFATSSGELRNDLVVSDVLSVDKFYVGHVDAFEMLVYGVQYVGEKGTTMGGQLAAVVLFWVPRTMWEDKPLGTGPLLGSSFIDLMKQTANTNLSAPLVLEGYINFGVAGVILFAVLCGIALGSLDRALVERRGNALAAGSMVYRIDAIAAPLLGLWVYVLRGSLIAAFAYSCGIVLAGLFVWMIFFRRVTK